MVFNDSMELHEREDALMKILNSIPAEKMSQYRLVQQMDRRIRDILALGNRSNYEGHNENIFTHSVDLQGEWLSLIGTHAEWFMMFVNELREEIREQTGYRPGDFTIIEKFTEAHEWFEKHKLAAPLPVSPRDVFACMSGWCNAFRKMQESYGKHK